MGNNRATLASELLNKTLNMIPWGVRGKIKSMPVIASLQRRLVSKFLDGKEFTHHVNSGPAAGINFRVLLPDDKGIWTGTYESYFAGRLASAVRKGTVALDIGSWHGFFAGVMAAQGAGKIHVFEPLPANIERIQQLISLNPDKQIVLHACAVGNRETEMDLVLMPETSMSKLEESSFQASDTSDNRLRVRVRSIDTMVFNGEIESPELIKLDVEGAEMMVLEGAKKTLQMHHPEIFAEIHSTDLLEQCTSFLTTHGYLIEDLDEDPIVARSKDVFQIRAYVE